MPVYEYQCPLCDHELEDLQPLGSDPPFCPRCQEAYKNGPTVVSAVMVKQISRTTFALKGDGWFKDHYGLKPAPPTTQE
jgi:putative FmdB family regulatory protein